MGCIWQYFIYYFRQKWLLAYPTCESSYGILTVEKLKDGLAHATFSLIYE